MADTKSYTHNKKKQIIQNFVIFIIVTRCTHSWLVLLHYIQYMYIFIQYSTPPVNLDAGPTLQECQVSRINLRQLLSSGQRDNPQSYVVNYIYR